MKALKGLLIFGGAVIVGKLLMSLRQASENITAQVSARVHKLTTQGIIIALGYNIKNPTNVNLEVSVPLITITYNGKQLGQSSLTLTTIPGQSITDQGRIRIEKHKETGTVYTEVTLPYFSLISAGFDLLKQLKGRLPGESGQKVRLGVVVTARVYKGAASFPFTYKETIEV